MRTLQEEMALRKERDAELRRAVKTPDAKGTMRSSLFEGGFFGAMTGLSQPFLIPFALLFGAGNTLVSLLGTVPSLLGGLIQLWGPRIVAFCRGRKRYLVMVFVIQAGAWLLLPFVSLVPDPGARLLLCVLLAVVAASLTHNTSAAWMSYMGDVVKVKERARFFGKRNGIIALTTFLATLLGGLLLSLLESGIAIAFGLLFLLAATARLGSAWFMGRGVEKGFTPPASTFSFTTFLRRAPRTDFGRYVRLTSLFRASAGIAAPFIVVYQLKVLGLGYVAFTTLQAASVVGSVIAMRAWGPLADRFGNKRVIVWSCFLTTLVPLLYLTTRSVPLLVGVEVLSGFVWAGYTLGTSGYALEAASPKSRQFVLGYASLVTNATLLLAGLLGSWLLSLSDGVAAFVLLFAVSGALRFLLAVVMALRLAELRHVELVPNRRGLVTSLASLLPQQGLVYAAMEHRPEEFMTTPKEAVAESLRRRRAQHMLEELGEKEDFFDGMSLRERELYTKRFVERGKR